MGKNTSPKAAQTVTRYVVRCANDNSHVCGPYDDISDANREVERLNREAALGRTEPSEAHPRGQALEVRGRTLKIDGVPRAYEVVTESGVLVVN